MCKRTYSPFQLRIIDKVKKNSNVCYYCGKELTDNNITIDHKQPYSRGGMTLEDNLVVACSHCNTEKADLNEDEYFEYLQRKEEYLKTPPMQLLISVKNNYEKFTQKYINIKNEIKELDNLLQDIKDNVIDKRFNVCNGYKQFKSIQDIWIKQEQLKGEQQSYASYNNFALQQIKSLDSKINFNKNLSQLKNQVKQDFQSKEQKFILKVV